MPPGPKPVTPKNRKRQRPKSLALSGCLCSSSDHASSRSAVWSRLQSFLIPVLSGLARRRSSGCPAPRVSDRTGDEAPSCPGSSVFLPCQRMDLRVAPIRASFSLALRKLPGRPGSLLRALPPMSVRVAPFARSSGCTGDGGFRVAPNLSSFGGTVSNSPGRPGSSLLQPLPLMNRRVAPRVSSSGFAGGEFFRLPRSSSPSAVPIGGSPSFPGSAAFRHLPFPLLRVTPDRLPRRVDDESPLRSNFASPVYPADVSPGCPKVASTGCAADESSNSLGSCFPAYTAMFP